MFCVIPPNGRSFVFNRAEPSLTIRYTHYTRRNLKAMQYLPPTNDNQTIFSPSYCNSQS